MSIISLRAKTNDEIAAEIRAKRATLLAASDWTQMPDGPLGEAQRATWAEYRQALRDLPQAADLSVVTWPDPPE